MRLVLCVSVCFMSVRDLCESEIVCHGVYVVVKIYLILMFLKLDLA